MLCYAILCCVGLCYVMLRYPNAKFMHHCSNKWICLPALSHLPFHHCDLPLFHLLYSSHTSPLFHFTSRFLHMLFHPPERLLPPSTWLPSSHSSCVCTNTTPPLYVLATPNISPFWMYLRGNYIVTRMIFSVVFQASPPLACKSLTDRNHICQPSLLETQCVAHDRYFLKKNHFWMNLMEMAWWNLRQAWK